MSGFHKFMLFITATFIEKDREKKDGMKRHVDSGHLINVKKSDTFNRLALAFLAN